MACSTWNSTLFSRFGPLRCVPRRRGESVRGSVATPGPRRPFLRVSTKSLFQFVGIGEERGPGEFGIGFNGPCEVNDCEGMRALGEVKENVITIDSLPEWHRG